MGQVIHTISMHAYLCGMSKEQLRMIETGSATVELVSDVLVEVRFKPDVKLDVEGLGAIVAAKRDLIADRDVDVLAILPPELDFELNVLNVDHQTLNGGCGGAKRLALAAQSSFNQRISDIYYRYHPRTHTTRIFLTEEDARKWLATKLPEPSAS